VILEHSVLGLHTCLVPVLLSSPLLSCNPLSRALHLNTILLSYNPLSRALYLDSFPVCITSTSIPASLRCTCFDIARQILSTPCRHSGQTPIVHVGHYGQPTVTCDAVYNIRLERALLCPQFSGCLLQHHGGILVLMLRFAKRCPTWMMIMWMQPLMTQLWSSDTRYSNTRSPLYVRRCNSTSTNIDK
jgi:hypothetical protein